MGLEKLAAFDSQYRQVVDNQAKMQHEGCGTSHSDKGFEIKGNHMEEDVTPRAGDGRQPKECQMLTKKNVHKLHKRPGAAKWV